MSQMQDDDVPGEPLKDEAEAESEMISESSEQSPRNSPGPASQSPRMTVIDEADEMGINNGSSRSFNNSVKVNNSVMRSSVSTVSSSASISVSSSLKSPGSQIKKLEAHAKGILQSMENAKKELFLPDMTQPSTGKLSVNTHETNPKDRESKSADTKNKQKMKSAAKESSKAVSKSKTDALLKRFSHLSGVKAVETSLKAGAKSKRDALTLRFRKKGRSPKTTEKSRSEKGLHEAEPEAEKRKRRYKRNPRDSVFEEPPKVEGETNTDTTHDGLDDGFDQERSSGSLDLPLNNDRDNSDKDQECDSSSSSASASNTTKTESGILENDKGDRVINASRITFFIILGISAVTIAFLAFYFFKENETKQFEKQVEAQAEEILLYTQHNVDSVFATLKGLSVSTTSVVKRQFAESGWPAGFINVPDVEFNIGLAQNSSKALVLAYMPKVLKKDYDKWVEYSIENKYWIADEQPGGPVDVEPIIRPYIWEYTDYKWEAFPDPVQFDMDIEQEVPRTAMELEQEVPDSRRAIEDIAEDIIGRSSQNGLRGFTKPQEPKPFERPVDCSGNDEAARRCRYLAYVEDYDRDLVTTDDNKFFGGDVGATDDNKFLGGDNKRGDNQYNSGQEPDEPYKFSPSKDDDDYGTVKLGPSMIQQAPYKDDYQTPVWQLYPIPTISNASAGVQVINYNLADRLTFFKAVEYMENSRAPVFLDVLDNSAWFLISENRDILQTVVAYPVFQDFSANASIVGFFTAILPWKQFFVNSLGDLTNDMVVVMHNSCGEIFSVNVTKNRGAEIIGFGDSHDSRYDNLDKNNFPFARDYAREDFVDFQEEICKYDITMYPTRSFESSVRTRRPLIISIVILLVFVFTSFAFMLFDCLVTKRQNRLLNTALRQNAIVNSLFPKNIQRKLMAEADETILAAERKKNVKRRNLTTFLNNDQTELVRDADPFDSKPIADLFPHTTIMFADISGFTAWSSAREPAAVFTLLETIYRAFDEIAKRRRVFKVEVVGDCYVAVCGLPDPRKDHFAVMCRFAQDCMAAMHVHTKELEVRLGPDTGDLSLRVGLHSGPVVAGVLRGDKSRFQLFGDTMNTASRMESTGSPNRIQLSQATADLLILNGKEHWITKRVDKVRAKGKGELTTYFLLSVKKKTSSTNSASTSKIDEVVLVRSGNHSKGVKTVQKRNRVADWVVEMLGKLLKEMKAKRKLTGIRPDSKSTIHELENRSAGVSPNGGLENKTVIDEVAECLKLPGFHKSEKGGSGKEKPPAPLNKEVIDELQHYVYSVASLYKKNPFHNFEHASHVSMSCIKLLNRIASHDEENTDSSNNHTYGICSDPLTSFAIVFSALIHDVDHCGVPNAQLVKEHSAVATMYKNKSVAEQNSIDIGWGLLMEPTYSNLRRHIYTTTTEYKCFRQIVVNCIMATDICEKDLIKARNKRWDLAFSSDKNCMSQRNLEVKDDKSSYRKATVVIEHLIQLSDVSHTMQHWHMYRRWNERLYEEGYKAYIEGRAEKDPTENWYQGELGFYDFYIIPLAKKIKQCAVFGVSSDEYLSYAVANREEWEERGREVVKDMVTKVQAIYHKEIDRQLKDSESKEDNATSIPALGSALSSNPNLSDLVPEDETSKGVVTVGATGPKSLSGHSDGDGDNKGIISPPKDLEAEGVVASDAIPTSVCDESLESAHSKGTRDNDNKNSSEC